MTTTMNQRGILGLVFALAVLVPAAFADGVPTFKSRKEQEKKFVSEACEAILKAAHFTSKERALEKYEFEEVRKGRAKLIMRGSFKGAVSRKQYFADIVVHLDTLGPDRWEVLRIEYSDNDNVPYNRRKVDELIKKFNSRD